MPPENVFHYRGLIILTRLLVDLFSEKLYACLYQMEASETFLMPIVKVQKGEVLHHVICNITHKMTGNHDKFNLYIMELSNTT